VLLAGDALTYFFLIQWVLLVEKFKVERVTEVCHLILGGGK